ncbi:hypothetical protein [Saccharopolyspora shandongensis]|uniref:hypothetical protein n=1 Tax=Saccharopolyspora shandongensis TaxID=418495 RepID=UPI0033E827C0
MKIDPLTGMLIQVIVVESPPEVEALWQIPVDGEAQSPVVDRSLWEGQDNQDGSDKSVVFTVEDLGFIRADDRIRLLFSDQKPARYLQCENVVVAISREGNLVEITAIL